MKRFFSIGLILLSLTTCGLADVFGQISLNIITDVQIQAAEQQASALVAQLWRDMLGVCHL